MKMLQAHTPEQIKVFAKKMKISPEQAGYIEHMREWYLCFEHDYIKKLEDDPQPVSEK